MRLWSPQCGRISIHTFHLSTLLSSTLIFHTLIFHTLILHTLIFHAYHSHCYLALSHLSILTISMPLAICFLCVSKNALPPLVMIHYNVKLFHRCALRIKWLFNRLADFYLLDDFPLPCCRASSQTHSLVASRTFCRALVELLLLRFSFAHLDQSLTIRLWWFKLLWSTSKCFLYTFFFQTNLLIAVFFFKPPDHLRMALLIHLFHILVNLIIQKLSKPKSTTKNYKIINLSNSSTIQHNQRWKHKNGWRVPEIAWLFQRWLHGRRSGQSEVSVSNNYGALCRSGRTAVRRHNRLAERAEHRDRHRRFAVQEPYAAQETAPWLYVRADEPRENVWHHSGARW